MASRALIITQRIAQLLVSTQSAHGSKENLLAHLVGVVADCPLSQKKVARDHPVC